MRPFIRLKAAFASSSNQSENEISASKLQSRLATLAVSSPQDSSPSHQIGFVFFLKESHGAVDHSRSHVSSALIFANMSLIITPRANNCSVVIGQMVEELLAELERWAFSVGYLLPELEVTESQSPYESKTF